jgi:protein-disulfide isomerase
LSNSQIVRFGCFSIGLLLASSTAVAQSVDRKEVEKIVREYILQNPQIIGDALTELQNRSEAAEAEARTAVVAAETDALLRSDDDVILGNPDGDVTLVEFFDFNCGYCKRAAPDVKALVAEDSGLRVVLKDFPILGSGSVEAAKVALSVKRLEGESAAQEFHARLIGVQGQINAGRALALAEEMGMDRKRIEEEMRSEEIAAIISSNLSLAQRLGLTGTPSFIVGDQVIMGAVGKEPLQNAIEKSRK